MSLYCPNCGHENRPTARFCSNCRTQLSNTPQQKFPPQVPNQAPAAARPAPAAYPPVMVGGTPYMPPQGNRASLQQQYQDLQASMLHWEQFEKAAYKKLKSTNTQLIISWIIFIPLLFTMVLWIGPIIWDIFIYQSRNKATMDINNAQQQKANIQNQMNIIQMQLANLP